MGVEVVEAPPRKAQKATLEGETFAVVPVQILEHPRLSDAAKLTLAWVRGHPPNWDFYISDLKRKLRFGNSKWAGVRKNLQENGFLNMKRKFGDWEVVFNLKGNKK